MRESDQELMRRVQAGDSEAFGALYDRHSARAYGVARGICGDSWRAEDAVQEGFLALWRGRAQYRSEIGTFQAWAMTTVRRRALDGLRAERAEKRPRLVALEKAREIPGPDTTEPAVIARDRAEALASALRRLPEDQAEVIALAFFGELSHQEIAQQLQLPPGTVKGRARLGLEKLRYYVTDQGWSSESSASAS